MNSATQTDLSVANTILAQFGGNRFIAMTGAKNMLGDAVSLQFQLPRGARSGINSVVVSLGVCDTYTVVFHKLGTAKNGYEGKEIVKAIGVHADGLRPLFTRVTGLDASL